MSAAEKQPRWSHPEEIFRSFVANANALWAETQRVLRSDSMRVPSALLRGSPAAPAESTTPASAAPGLVDEGTAPLPLGKVTRLLAEAGLAEIETAPAPVGEVVQLLEQSAAVDAVDAVDAEGAVPLTRKKKSTHPPPPGGESTILPLPRPDAWGHEEQNQGEDEAEAAVPDVAAVHIPSSPLREKGEGGQAPAGELDRVLTDMNVLLRYGYIDQVRDRLDGLAGRYPQDLLLLRRIAEFHVETGDREAAMDSLFTLAKKLFERRNVLGMRRALEQVLVLDPTNRRAYRLLGLLDERPITGTG